MKKLLLFTFVFFGLVSKTFSETNSFVSYDQPISFTENNVSFAVFQNGAFDFYIDRVAGVNISFNTPHVSLSFNNGYNYNPYVQYDRYGAVIQVENIPIYYDYYGRVSQIGSVRINYHNGWVNRVGGLHIYYNSYGAYAHFSGYINRSNRHWTHKNHRYFAYPHYEYAVVSHKPYRSHYHPKRYVYHNNHHKNHYYKNKHHKYYAHNSKGKKANYNRRATQEIPKRKSDYQRTARRSDTNGLYRGTPIENEPYYRKAVSRSSSASTSRNSNTKRTSKKTFETKPKKRNATDLFKKGSPEIRSVATSNRTTRNSRNIQKRKTETNARALFPETRTKSTKKVQNSNNSLERKYVKNSRSKKKS